MTERPAHKPVLLSEALAALDPRPGAIAVDCTAGLGGHALELLRRISPGGRLVALDLDPANLEKTRARLTPAGDAFSLHHANFAGLPQVLAAAGLDGADLVLADLGVASTQIDDPARGFSYRRPGPLDLRMDPTRGESAARLLARIDLQSLEDALRDLGDEPEAARIAAHIVSRRDSEPITTTEELSAIVAAARGFTIQRAAGAKLHPAARTFQALRMLVNREAANLERLLAVLPTVLRPGGRAALIAFHSGEDRRVKHAFREGLRAGVYSAVSEDPIVPGAPERAENPRSRSAKLRWARRAIPPPAPPADRP